METEEEAIYKAALAHQRWISFRIGGLVVSSKLSLGGKGALIVHLLDYCALLQEERQKRRKPSQWTVLP